MRHVLALALLLALWAAPAVATTYLSDYSYGGNSYYSNYGSGGNGPLSQYSSGGYTLAGGTSTNLGYSGPDTSISRPHRASWNSYVQARQRQGWRYGADQRWYNPAGIRLGWPTPTATPQPCGNYQRAPAGCWSTTTRFDPMLHAEY